MLLFKSIGDEWFIKFVKEYLTNLVEIQRDSVLKQLNELKTRLGKFNLITAFSIEYSELETFYPKYGHSVVANKDFVFITGGEYNDMDKSFEILVLKDGEREKQRKEERKTLMDTERVRRRKEEEEKKNINEENKTKIDDTYEPDDIFICRGPNLKNRRSKHASIIIQNYLK